MISGGSLRPVPPQKKTAPASFRPANETWRSDSPLAGQRNNVLEIFSLNAISNDMGKIHVDHRVAVFVKGVVRRFHAASLILGMLISVSGLSQTGPAGCQLRVLPDQRFGFCARAFA